MGTARPVRRPLVLSAEVSAMLQLVETLVHATNTFTSQAFDVDDDDDDHHPQPAPEPEPQVHSEAASEPEPQNEAAADYWAPPTEKSSDGPDHAALEAERHNVAHHHSKGTSGAAWAPDGHRIEPAHTRKHPTKGVEAAVAAAAAAAAATKQKVEKLPKKPTGPMAGQMAFWRRWHRCGTLLCPCKDRCGMRHAARHYTAYDRTTCTHRAYAFCATACASCGTSLTTV
eukprot:SAG11_NODE_740_length_7421_cov_6.264818_4_plen_228_part_00